MANNRFAGKSRALERMKKIPLQARIAARDELRVQAAKLVKAIRPNVPEDEGDLADSLQWQDESSLSTAQLGRVAVVVTEGYDQEDDPDNRKARAVEFGRPDMEAQPHFYPTYRALKRRMQNAIARKVRSVIRRIWGAP